MKNKEITAQEEQLEELKSILETLTKDEDYLARMAIRLNMLELRMDILECSKS